MKGIWNKYKGIIILIIVLGLFILFVYSINDKSKNNKNIRDVDDAFLRNYKINEVINVYLTDEDIAKKYLSEYVNLLLYHREEAFKIVNADTLVEKFIDYDSFNKYVKNMLNDSFVKATVKSYTYDIENGKKVMRVMDIDGNKFTFFEDSIMNYTVKF